MVRFINHLAKSVTKLEMCAANWEFDRMDDQGNYQDFVEACGIEDASSLASAARFWVAPLGRRLFAALCLECQLRGGVNVVLRHFLKQAFVG